MLHMKQKIVGRKWSEINMKEKIIKKYKEKIKEIYKFKDDNEVAHSIRDNIYRELIEELGYKELSDLLEQVEEDIGFWYA